MSGMNEKIIEVESLINKGQVQNGIRLLKQIWASLSWEEIFPLVINFDQYIGAIDSTLNLLSSQRRYADALKLH